MISINDAVQKELLDLFQPESLDNNELIRIREEELNKFVDNNPSKFDSSEDEFEAFAKQVSEKIMEKSIWINF